MDLKHIRSFAAVAREGNLTRAAEHLHLTQPALSLQLKSFQESLDLTLFSRSAQGLSPNAERALRRRCACWTRWTISSAPSPRCATRCRANCGWAPSSIRSSCAWAPPCGI